MSKAVPKLNKRMFQDARIWIEIISLPYSQQKSLRTYPAPEMDKMKFLPGGCCNQSSEWIRQDYYEQIKEEL